ncbi:serine/threonine protein kinase [Sporothrix schenckii ATCC 58251]|uniref:non-specific serine/threonine protein kinase n=1 Tax=Sporothrix schenckii (strain ATCC 58251 / de Perez 2211183) TaxID=1391915 RepID=U7Q0W8_SPOS1|nr:serine/threonine protein kinase [Sporothrix schenckii ATCC 58251]
MPQSLALFFLNPLNRAAYEVAGNDSNKHLLWEPRVFGIGHVASKSGNPTVLATIGRDGDIYIPDENISRVHCSFELDADTGIVMLYDRSNSQTTQTVGNDAFPFEFGRPRKVVVMPDINTTFGIGGIRSDKYQFTIVWPDDTAALQQRKSAMLQPNPRLARTLDLLRDTALPTGMLTRIHTPGGPSPDTIRFKTIGEKLGSGSFGEVSKAVNVDTGQLLAVKDIKQAGRLQNPREWLYLKREIQALSSISHEHIVEFLGFQDSDQPVAHIFMALKTGTLHSLVTQSPGSSVDKLATTTLHHMLKALDYLAVKGLIHRDLKPENILYDPTPDGKYHFCLGDLGFCNSARVAVTHVGTPDFTAPEIIYEEPQTPRVDIWSLFVTLLWVLDVDGFRGIVDGRRPRQESIRKTVLHIAATNPHISPISAMGRRDPDKRATAAQMLVKCFNGDGLSTNPRQIGPIAPLVDTVTVPTTPVKPPPARNALPTPVATATRTPQTPDPFYRARPATRGRPPRLRATAAGGIPATTTTTTTAATAATNATGAAPNRDYFAFRTRATLRRVRTPGAASPWPYPLARPPRQPKHAAAPPNRGNDKTIHAFPVKQPDPNVPRPCTMPGAFVEEDGTQ